MPWMGAASPLSHSLTTAEPPSPSPPCCDGWDKLGIVYIVLPVLLFFALFTRIYVAIPASLVLLVTIYRVLSIPTRTRWLGRHHIPLLLVCAALAFTLDGGTLFGQKDDWFKHYAILNALGSNPSPFSLPRLHFEDVATGSMRYTIAFYIVPALLHTLTGISLKHATSMFVLTGLFIFFNIMREVYDSKRIYALAIFAFIFFSGADCIGMIATNPLLIGKYQLEWWAGLLQYSSNLTVLLWVPQHGLPAWIICAILIKQNRFSDELIGIGPPVLFATLLWSPFITMGLVPLAVYTAVAKGRLRFDAIFFASLLCIAAPLAAYLGSGSNAIPKEFGYLPGQLYLAFVLVEFAVFTAFLMVFSTGPDTRLLCVATVSLLLIPLVKIGVYNDFAMRASIPSLAVTSLLLPSIVARLNRPSRIILAVIFVAGMITPLAELHWSFRSDYVSSMQNTRFEEFRAMYSTEDARDILCQYIAPVPGYLFR